MIPIRVAFSVLALFIAGAALAQSASRVPIRGTIESVAADGGSLQVRTREGQSVSVRLTKPRHILAVVGAALADIKPGAFVGVGAMPGAGGVQMALEVHIFPEAMRGVGEGFHPFDLEPGSTMTNGSIQARIEGVEGPRLTVTYKGGRQTIVIDKQTRIVAMAAGGPGDLKPGAAIVARAVKAADGAYDAAYILVGRNGVRPPM